MKSSSAPGASTRLAHALNRPTTPPRQQGSTLLRWRRIGLIATLLLAFGFAPSPAFAQAGNTATGTGALVNITTGSENTADGYFALNADTAGSANTAVGTDALLKNTTGSNNSAMGASALLWNTSGQHNTASGYGALYNNTIGIYNTATGSSALFNNKTGNYNTATGKNALVSNTGGNYNMASGASALLSNTNGYLNVASGYASLQSNDVGYQNTASGVYSLLSNSNGYDNTAAGFSALLSNTTGRANTAGGAYSLQSNQQGKNNSASGVNSLYNNTTGNNNIALGFDAGRNLTTGSNNIAIGALGVAGEANTIRIGKPATQQALFVAGVSGSTVPNGVQVVVNPSGRLGTIVSSAKYKEKIKPMDNASEALLALKPVTFQYKHDLDPDGIPQFGLVAEEVEKVNPDLVARDADGKVYTVRYEAVNAMLLNEFLKEHREVDTLKATVAELKARDAKQGAILVEQNKQIEALTAGLQKVSNQMQLVNSSTQLAAH